MVRAPAEREQAAPERERPADAPAAEAPAAEAPAPQAPEPAAERAPDALDRFRGRLPEPYVQHIGQGALRLAPHAAAEQDGPLQTRLAKAKSRLERRPLLRDGVAWWGRNHGNDAAKLLAVNRAIAERGGPSVENSQLDRWRQLFTPDQAESLQQQANDLYNQLQGIGGWQRRDNTFLREQQADLRQRNPFGQLRDLVGRWAQGKAASAEETVAIENELGRRKRLAEIERTTLSGEATVDVLPADATQLTVDATNAIQQQLKGKDPAVLQTWANELGNPTPHDAFGTACALAARQELVECARPDLVQQRDALAAQAELAVDAAEPQGMEK